MAIPQMPLFSAVTNKEVYTMTKKIFSTVLLMLMIAALMIFTAGCNSQDSESAARIAELEKENAALKAQIEAMSAQISDDVLILALQDWSLDAKAWSDANGATVTFTASPISYTDGQRAALSVRMGDLEAESTNCVWDGSVFSGSVDLSAADGYSYYCILTNLDGTQQEIELNAPGNVTDETLVYLGSSLTPYANLIVEDWEANATSMKIKTGYIQAQMPRLTYEDASFTIEKSALVLKMNGEEVDREEIALTAGEGEGSYETAVTSRDFTMPAMEEDYQLDLWLEVTLNSGSVITVSGGSWYSTDGALQLAVG